MIIPQQAVSGGQGVFAKRIVGGRGELVYLVQGTHKQEPYWCILMVDRAKHDVFKRKLGGSMQPQDFGKVLRWGYGEEPPPDRSITH